MNARNEDRRPCIYCTDGTLEEGFSGLCHAHYERRRNGRVPMDAPMCRTSDERFWARVEKREDGCWIWTGATGGEGRYGMFAGSGRNARMAHRWAYERFVGPIPEGLELDHLCRVTLCVNPAHVEPVTHYENLMRGVGIAARNARKTHCKRGHEFTPENTRVMSTGGRSCIECENTYHYPRKLRAKRLGVPVSTLEEAS